LIVISVLVKMNEFYLHGRPEGQSHTQSNQMAPFQTTTPITIIYYIPHAEDGACVGGVSGGTEG
jgi:hypothetical protein